MYNGMVKSYLAKGIHLMKDLRLDKELLWDRICPLIMSVIILIGYFGEIEVYTASLNLLITAFALLASSSIKPFIFFVLTFFYQITVANSPMEPQPSDNYFTGLRPYIFIGSALVLAVCFFIYFFKNKLLFRTKLTKIPLLLPMVALTLGLLANGLLSEDYKIGNALWGSFLVVTYVVLFIIVYLGAKSEDVHKMTDYFLYITILMSWILLAQFAGALLTNNYFTEGGGVNRGAIVLGIGGCNEVGFHVSMLIPMNFYGFMKGKHPYFSLFTAFAMYGATLLSTSRNSMLIGSAYFIFCLVLCLFFGDRKKQFRSILPLAVLFLMLVIFIFPDPVMSVVNHYRDRGMGDSGRFDIWKKCFKIFRENPLFGVGFFGLDVGLKNGLIISTIPEFAHNTVFELLAATGMFGFVGYTFYRISTLKYLIHKPTLDRFMLMVAASMLAVESLLDNYLFHVFSGFYYTIALVLAAMLYEKQMSPPPLPAEDEPDESAHSELEGESETSEQDMRIVTQRISEILADAPLDDGKI